MKSLCINQDFRRLAAILRFVGQREPDIVWPGKISLVIEKPPTQEDCWSYLHALGKTSGNLPFSTEVLSFVQ